MQENVASGRTIAIGDIHGCSTALHALIAEIDPRPEDTIVTLGDYIDWGPDSRGVIDLLIGLSRRCRLLPLLGNHKEMLLAALESGSELRYWPMFGGEETLNSYEYDGGAEMIPEAHVRFPEVVPGLPRDGHAPLRARQLRLPTALGADRRGLAPLGAH
jgi:serine/threonine protein phosphatase 1